MSSGTWQDYFDVPLVIKFHNTGISSDKTRRKCWNYAKAIYLITICYMFAQNFKYLKFYNCKFYNGVCAGKNFKFLKLQAQIHASSGTWQDYFDVPLVIKFQYYGILPSKQARLPRFRDIICQNGIISNKIKTSCLAENMCSAHIFKLLVMCMTRNMCSAHIFKVDYMYLYAIICSALTLLTFQPNALRKSALIQGKTPLIL